jgi:PQQ-dependent catabolism-associated beta-propeller protein
MPGLRVATLPLVLAAVSFLQFGEARSATGERRVYVTNEMSGDLSIVDGNSFKVVQTLALGKRPRGLKLSADGKRLYVALSGSPVAAPGVDESTLPPADKEADGIGVVDLEQRRIMRVIKGVSDPEQVALSADEKRMYVASEDTGTAVVIDVPTGKTLATITVGGEPEGVEVSPDGKLVYVTSEEDHQIAVIDTRTNKLVKRIEVGQRPRVVVFSADGARAYVTGELDASLMAIDVAKGEVVRRTTIPGENVRPMGVVVTSDGKTLYVATGRGGKVARVDAQTLRVTGEVAVGPRPWNVALTSDGKFLFTANGPSNDVSVVDTEKLQVIRRIPVGNRPWGVIVPH